MAITLFLDDDRAKPSNNPSAGLGKSPLEMANHGHDAFFDRDVAKAGDNP